MDHTEPFVYSTIIEENEERKDFIAHHFLKNILNINDTVIAGGIVVYFLNNFTTLRSVGDIDIFILNANKSSLKKVALLLEDKFQYIEKYYLVENSTLKIHFKGYMPFQIILTNCNCAETLISDFDLDFVQCAITKNLHCDNLNVIRTEKCVKSHFCREILYIKKDSYNRYRFFSRIRKGMKKGFNLPENILKNYENKERIPFEALNIKIYKISLKHVVDLKYFPVYESTYIEPYSKESENDFTDYYTGFVEGLKYSKGIIFTDIIEASKMLKIFDKNLNYNEEPLQENTQECLNNKINYLSKSESESERLDNNYYEDEVYTSLSERLVQSYIS